MQVPESKQKARASNSLPRTKRGSSTSSGIETRSSENQRAQHVESGTVREQVKHMSYFLSQIKVH